MITHVRIDKFLTVCKLFNKREEAKQAVLDGDVIINDKSAKPSSWVKEQDVISIDYLDFILEIQAHVNKEENKIYVGYDIISKRKRSYISC